MELRLIHRGQRSPPLIRAPGYIESLLSGRICQGLRDYLPGAGKGSDFIRKVQGLNAPDLLSQPVSGQPLTGLIAF